MNEITNNNITKRKLIGLFLFHYKYNLLLYARTHIYITKKKIDIFSEIRKYNEIGLKYITNYYLVAHNKDAIVLNKTKCTGAITAAVIFRIKRIQQAVGKC